MRKILFLLSCCIGANIFGFECDWNAALELTAGYRNDHIATSSKAFDPPGTLTVQDRLKAKNISIYEIGLKARATLDEQLFIKAYADFGWAGSGTFTEDAAFPIIVSEALKGHIHKGRTRDYSIGMGYLFGCCGLINIGPMAGYAYDYQKIQMGNVDSNGVNDPALDNLSYNMRWQGPWIGLEADFWWACANFVFGYEYHWSHWKANWTLDGADVADGAFSDKRTSKHAHGNVVYVQASYPVCDCWDVGLGLKYQYWEARRGSLSPLAGSLAAVGASEGEVDTIPKASWSSIQIQLAVGYSF